MIVRHAVHRECWSFPKTGPFEHEGQYIVGRLETKGDYNFTIFTTAVDLKCIRELLEYHYVFNCVFGVWGLGWVGCDLLAGELRVLGRVGDCFFMCVGPV